MLDPTKLGFPDEDSATMPQVRRPFGAKKKTMKTANVPPGSPVPDHPADLHLTNAVKAKDHATKQKHVFKALGAIRKAATGC